MTETIPTLKAIHICNSHKPTHKPKLQKEYAFTDSQKNFKIFLSTLLKKIKTPDTQARQDNAKRTTNDRIKAQPTTSGLNARRVKCSD